MGNYVLSHLKELESEAIFVIREIAAQFENPCTAIFWRERFYTFNPFG